MLVAPGIGIDIVCFHVAPFERFIEVQAKAVAKAVFALVLAVNVRERNVKRRMGCHAVRKGNAGFAVPNVELGGCALGGGQRRFGEGGVLVGKIFELHARRVRALAVKLRGVGLFFVDNVQNEIRARTEKQVLIAQQIDDQRRV